jgi:hypothetical protein
MADQHPLCKAGAHWTFIQPNLGYQSKYMSVDKDDKKQEHSLRHMATCREGVVSHTRGSFQKVFCQKRSDGVKAWSFNFEKAEDLIDLANPSVKKAGDTKLLVNASMLSKTRQKQFLEVADYLVGNVCVLLNPHERVEGEWWVTDPDDYLIADTSGKNCVGWNGTDNFFLHHPALISLVIGLFRQALLLTKAGYGAKVLETVERSKVDKALTTGSWRQALSNCRKLRTWLEVYTPSGNAYIQNFPFPEGYWLRFMRLHQAIRRHGYQELFGEDFAGRWNLLSKQYNCSGMYSFWGTGDNNAADGTLQNTARKRLMKLGKPRQKEEGSSEGKPAPSDS